MAEAVAAPSRWPLLAASALLLAALVVSGLHPYDRVTWAMEVAPVMIVLPVLWATWRRFPLTNLLYACIVAHGFVLAVGGAYTYAHVPFGFDLQAWLGLSRNPYDKIGHFCQGFIPALAAREILIRGGYVQGRRMLAFLVVCIALAISAMQTSWWSGGRRWAWGRVPTNSSARRAIPGIRSPTCSWR